MVWCGTHGRMAHAMHIGSVKFLFSLLLSFFFLFLGFRGRGVLCYVRYGSASGLYAYTVDVKPRTYLLLLHAATTNSSDSK